MRSIRHTRPSNTGENGPGRIRLREALKLPTRRVIFAGWILRFGIWHSKPWIASTLIPETSQMKRAVFGNWFLMAIASSGTLRVRTLERLPLLISGEDFLGAALSTYSPARRSRSIDACVCALKSSHIPPSQTSPPMHTLTIYEQTIRAMP